MSHELRHPLNLIYINAELLARLAPVRDTPAAARAAAAIRKAVSSQAKIIDDLLDMARLNTGKLALDCRDIDLTDVAAQLVDVLRADPVAQQLDISLHSSGEPMFVPADPVRLEQVVLNLLSNAIKFTPSGGKVTVTLGVEDGQARLDVTDTGAGIDAASLAQIFGMFRQGSAKALRHHAGLGIGLALARQIVEQHGGRIEAASEGTDRGSRFSLWLPLSRHPVPGMPAPSPSPGACVAGRHLLLVDDDEDSARVFQTLLEMDGATVSIATTAREGLDLLRARAGTGSPVQLLVSDLSMPDMDGFDFIRAVRAMPALADLPAIAASGLGREKDVRAALDAGFSSFLTKPVAVEVLSNEIARLLPRPGR